MLTIGLCPRHCLLLESHPLLLLKDIVCFAFQVDQDLVFVLNLLFLIDDLLAEPILEGDEVVGVACEALIAAGSYVARR